ncbi:MAG TPA: phosphoadenylyl-sulfate reductase [Candidatus Saccharimonadales bacterium]|jgi:phosphoadenosine phosphosulfate reductase|nr:phosphoadenylyl-sulfate reductase [Candidatus Saccharimonadales bacterium]
MKTGLSETTAEQPAESLIEQAVRQNAGRFCITCSFQAEDMVVLDLVHRRVPGIAVLFLDTGYHFAETYAYRDRMAAAWDLNLVNLLPETTVAAQEQAHGLLYVSDPARCCQMRKVKPLMKALENFDVWFTGLRREQSATRANLKQVEQHQLPSGKQILKLNPLAGWKWPQVLDYTEQNHIEKLALYDDGYLSIGCEPCTSLPVTAGDPRSGRWSGKKLECGIHTFTTPLARQDE